MADYRIEPGGTVVVFLSDRATQRASGPKPKIGARLAFRTRTKRRSLYRQTKPKASRLKGRNFLHRHRKTCASMPCNRLLER